MLDGRKKAKGALALDLPEEAKALYKKALDHADLALGLDDAVKRKNDRSV